jgi:hypothetical protein
MRWNAPKLAPSIREVAGWASEPTVFSAVLIMAGTQRIELIVMEFQAVKMVRVVTMVNE